MWSLFVASFSIVTISFLVPCLFYVNKVMLPPHGTWYRTLIRPVLISFMLSNELKEWKRFIRVQIRKWLGRRPVMRVFVAADDPQSWTLLQTLPTFIERFANVDIQVIVIKLGVNAWATAKDKQLQWAIKDCGLFAALYRLTAPDSSISLPPTTSSSSSEVAVDLRYIEYDVHTNLPVDVRVRQVLEDVNAQLLHTCVCGAAHGSSTTGNTNSGASPRKKGVWWQRLFSPTYLEAESSSSSSSSSSKERAIRVVNALCVLEQIWGTCDGNGSGTGTNSSVDVEEEKEEEVGGSTTKMGTGIEADAGVSAVGLRQRKTQKQGNSDQHTPVWAKSDSAGSEPSKSLGCRISKNKDKDCGGNGNDPSTVAALERNYKQLLALGYYGPGVVEFEVRYSTCSCPVSC
jgi:hypothetical protein